MNKLLAGLALSLTLLATTSGALASPENTAITTGVSKAEQQAMTPGQALDRLKAGNKRFVNNTLQQHNFEKIRKNTAKGQFPYAVVLSCLDSRSSPDIIFDQGLGDIFIGRVAGNVVDTNMLGSTEFATKYAGSKLIVVMGHTDCGAVKGACAGVGENNLSKLLNEIQPAVDGVRQQHKVDCNDLADINAIAKQNIINQVDDIYQQSETIRQLVDTQQVMLVGAIHDLSSGKVDFFYNFKPEQVKQS